MLCFVVQGLLKEEVQAALKDCNEDPTSFLKYKNDPKVMKVSPASIWCAKGLSVASVMMPSALHSQPLQLLYNSLTAPLRLYKNCSQTLAHVMSVSIEWVDLV